MEIVSYPERIHVCLSDVELTLLFVLLCKYQVLVRDKGPDIYTQFTDTFISNIETLWGKKHD